MARSLAPPFCTPVNTRTYYLQDLLLTMVIFVLLIWLWVWCNAVAGYFVPSFPSSFRPPSFCLDTRDVTFYCEARARRMARSPSPLQIYFRWWFQIVNETKLLYGRVERTRHATRERNESVSISMIRTIGFAAAPPTNCLSNCYTFGLPQISCLHAVLYSSGKRIAS